MTLNPFRISKPKTTPSAVQGRITVLSADGERIGQWGGTECFLSRECGLGPCMVVRSSRHRRGQGTFFQLSGLRQVLSAHVQQGKLTVVLSHAQQRLCSVFINASPNDIDELQIMAGNLQDRSGWGTLERDVSKHAGGAAARGTGHKERRATAGGANVKRVKAAPLRDPTEAGIEKEYTESSEEEEAYSQESKTLSMALSNFPGSPIGSINPTEQYSALAEMHIPRQASPDTPAALKWSPDQAEAIRLLRCGYNVFVTGAAGTGKTTWLLRVVQEILPPRQTVLTAVTAGTARFLGGFTIHTFAGIGRGEGTLQRLLRKVKSKPSVVRSWQACEILILDEVGMLPAHLFSILDAVAREVRQEPSKPFGGIQLLVVGDFFQLSPVAEAGEELQLAFMSTAWQQCDFHCIEFTKNYRHSSDVEFGEGCEDIRQGRYTLALHTLLTKCLNQDLGERSGAEASLILSDEEKVHSYNQLRLDALPGARAYRYVSADYAMVPGADLDSEIPLPTVLTLKVGAQVMLLLNLPEHDRSLGLGTRGVVRRFVEQPAGGPALPIVQFVLPGASKEVLVPWVTMEVTDHNGRVCMRRRQVPLELAWALAVRRVQGITLPMVKVPLDSNFTESGQAYVAVSRVQTAADLCILALDAKGFTIGNPEVAAFYEKTFPALAEARSRCKAQMIQDCAALDAALAKLPRLQSRWQPYLEHPQRTKFESFSGAAEGDGTPPSKAQPSSKKIRLEKQEDEENWLVGDYLSRNVDTSSIADTVANLQIMSGKNIAAGEEAMLEMGAFASGDDGKWRKEQYMLSDNSPAPIVLFGKTDTKRPAKRSMQTADGAALNSQSLMRNSIAEGFVASITLSQLTQDSEARIEIQGTQTLEIMRRLLVEEDE